MPWTTPTLREVRALNRDNLAAYLPGADASVPNSVLRVLSDQNAGGAYLNLLYLDWLSKQFLPDTAEAEWLDRHAQIWLGGRKAATFAAGTVTVTGTQGVLLPAGTILGAPDATQYQTIGTVYVSQGPTVVGLIALVAGGIGNQAAGSQLSLSVAVSGVDAIATVVAINGGADAESDDDLRSRILLRIRNPPMGGDKSDYEQWALAVPGVTRVWVAPREMGVGTVTVRFMCDDLRATSGGYPTDTDIATVRAYLDTVRPVTIADLFVAAPIAKALFIRVLNLSNDTASTRVAIANSIAEMLANRASPGQTIFAAWVSAAISDAVGDASFDLVFSDAVMPSLGHMATLAGGGITFS